MRLYVNGALIASRRSDLVVTKEPLWSSYTVVGIGSNASDWLRYDGKIDVREPTRSVSVGSNQGVTTVVGRRKRRSTEP